MHTTAPCQQRTSTAPTSRLARTAARWWRAYWSWRARQATVLILRSLDERTLRDIGISPSEIVSCVHGKGDRRRSYDERWAERR